MQVGVTELVATTVYQRQELSFRVRALGIAIPELSLAGLQRDLDRDGNGKFAPLPCRSV